MRHELETILGGELRFLAIETRERLCLTQKEMSRLLQMSESSYSDIETGKTKCSALTSILILDMQDDPRDFLQRLERKFAEWYETEMKSV
ncbi:MAG: helix-turn-helix domain-containing protein [Ruminococcaceae bacterium]|nr:helix-turn-helix domain-containing protein [Oscillospiraceae bacterium]